MNGSDQSYSGPDQPVQEDLPVVTPPVVVWFRVYCVLMSLLYLLCLGLGITMLVMRSFFAREMKEDAMVVTIQGSLYAGLGLVFLIAFAAAFFFPRKKWVWIYDLVLICLGMTSCCCVPACIPLLIFWLKPEVKAYFGMEG